jgi:hypothetical protein
MNRLRAPLLLALALLVAAAPSAAAGIVPRSLEKPVTDDAGRQGAPAGVVIPSGTVLAWEDEARGVVVRWFDRAGDPIGDPLVMASSDPIPPLPFSRVRLRRQIDPSLAGRGDDSFLLAHTEEVTERSADIFFDQSNLLSSRVLSRLYAADGSSMARPVELAGGATVASRPVVIAAGSGFWAAWQQKAGGPGIYVQRLNPRGQPVAAPVRVADGGELMALASGGGRTLVVWVKGREFMARLLGADGAPLAPQFVVTTRRARPTSTAAVAVQPDGSFLIVLQRSSHANARIYGQLISRDGAPVGKTELLNAATGDAYTGPQVVPLAGGRWLVTWITWVGNFRVAVEYGVFDAALVATDRGVVNERTITAQAEAALAARDGRIAVAWEGYDERNRRSLRTRLFEDAPPRRQPRR